MQSLIKKNFSSLQLTDKVVKGMFGTENFNNNPPPPPQPPTRHYKKVDHSTFISVTTNFYKN